MSLLHLLVQSQVWVISPPNVPVTSQHDLNLGLKPANPGIIGKVASPCGIETPIYTIYGLLYTIFGLDRRHTGLTGRLFGQSVGSIE